MYIYCLVPEGEAVGSDDVGHSTYVQYVEGTSEQAIFTNGQMYIFLDYFLITKFIKKKYFLGHIQFILWARVELCIKLVKPNIILPAQILILK